MRYWVSMVLMLAFLLSCEKTSEKKKEYAPQAAPKIHEGLINIGCPRFLRSPCLDHTWKIQETEKGETQVDFELSVGLIKNLDGAYAQVKRFWGWEETKGEGPSKLLDQPFIKRISLTINGKNVSFPPAAYADLVQARLYLGGYCIREDGDKNILMLSGGDAGTGWIAKFTILNNKVIRREMWYGECPEDAPTVRNF
jgi:hypothetical protein